MYCENEHTDSASYVSLSQPHSYFNILTSSALLTFLRSEVACRGSCVTHLHQLSDIADGIVRFLSLLLPLSICLIRCFATYYDLLPCHITTIETDLHLAHQTSQPQIHTSIKHNTL